MPVSQSRTLVANVQPLMTLNLRKQGSGGTAVIRNGAGEVLCAANETTCIRTYPKDTDVKLSVDPDAKTSFNGWADACASSTAGFSDCTLEHERQPHRARPGSSKAWPRRFGAIRIGNGAGSEDMRALAADGSGNIVVGGQIGGLVDFGGASPVGVETSRNVGFLAKFAPDGTHLWSRALSNPAGESRVNAVAVDSIGNVIAVGFFGSGGFGDGTNAPSTGSTDAFVAKYNGATGALMWASFVAGPGTDALLSVALDSNGNVIAAGHVGVGATTAVARPVEVGLPAPLPATDEDAVILKYTATGSILSARLLGGTGLSDARAVTVDGNNAVFVGGTFNGTQTLGGGTPLSASGKDAYLMKLTSDPRGRHRESLWKRARHHLRRGSGGAGVPGLRLLRNRDDRQLHELGGHREQHAHQCRLRQHLRRAGAVWRRGGAVGQGLRRHGRCHFG